MSERKEHIASFCLFAPSIVLSGYNGHVQHFKNHSSTRTDVFSAVLLSMKWKRKQENHLCYNAIFQNIKSRYMPSSHSLAGTQVGTVCGCAGTGQGSCQFLHLQYLQKHFWLLNNCESLLQWNLWIHPYSNINSDQNFRQWFLRNWGWGKTYSNYVVISKITSHTSESWYWITLHTSSLSQNMATGSLSDESWSDGSTKLSQLPYSWTHPDQPIR